MRMFCTLKETINTDGLPTVLGRLREFRTRMWMLTFFVLLHGDMQTWAGIIALPKFVDVHSGSLRMRTCGMCRICVFRPIIWIITKLLLYQYICNKYCYRNEQHCSCCSWNITTSHGKLTLSDFIIIKNNYFVLLNTYLAQLYFPDRISGNLKHAMNNQSATNTYGILAL